MIIRKHIFGNFQTFYNLIQLKYSLIFFFLLYHSFQVIIKFHFLMFVIFELEFKGFQTLPSVFSKSYNIPLIKYFLIIQLIRLIEFSLFLKFVISY
jgi:hypothetical protein